MDTNSYVIWTDGSCLMNPGRSAFAAVIEEHSDNGVVKKRWTVTGREAESTNQRAEILAAIEGLRAIPSDHEGDIVVRTDSKYLADGISLWMPRWKAQGLDKRPNSDLWKALNKLCDKKNVEFEWVRGHAGHAGNEAAHALASLTLHTEVV